MFRTSKRVWAGMVFTFLTAGVLGLSLTSSAFAVDPGEEKSTGLHHKDIKKVQETLRDKGHYSGKVDGLMGPETRAGIREYQKSEKLPVTGHLDAETSGKLGVGPESVGGSFKSAGKEVGEGGEQVGHEMKKGKPVAAGKEMGKSVGRAGKKVGEGVKEGVSTESDRGDQEKK